MIKERKYIIGLKYGKLKHYTFPYCYHHYSFAYDNGIKLKDVIETGLIVDKRIVIIECISQKHLQKRDYLKQINNNILQARQVESLYSYGYIREGD